MKASIQPPSPRPATLSARDRPPVRATDSDGADAAADPVAHQRAELTQQILAYDPKFDLALLDRAIDFAAHAHRKQRRASGEPFVCHPIAVASILAGYRVDADTIVGALLHDTVEDSATTVRKVTKEFGSQIAALVDGVTKVTRIRLRPSESNQAESLHKMLLAMTNDVRVLIIKLADRLHNMRTIRSLSADHQHRVAQETLRIYAPLAARVGLHEMREELDDLCFAVLNPEGRAAMIRRIETVRARTSHVIPETVTTIKQLLHKHNVSAEVTSRQKRPYSTWRKLESKGIEFSQLADIYAIRIIVQEPIECYQALGALHTQWPIVPHRFKDHISVPKPNGYQSLHTTLVIPGITRIEVQIRTREMHERAEGGIAAHWLYKSGTADSLADDHFHALRKWIDGIRDSTSPAESLELATSESLSGSVYCFTPNGRVIHLPQGATPIDFAYAVHTEIGHSCVGAKVDGKNAPLSQPLKSGQEVEILRSDAAHPTREQEHDVATARARSLIRRAVREREEKSRASFGERLAKIAFRRAGHEPTIRAFDLAAKRLGFKSVPKLMAAVGGSTLTSEQVVQTVYPERQTVGAEKPRTQPPSEAHHLISGAPGNELIHMAECCGPLPPESIVGIFSDTGDLVVHSIDCEVLQSHEANADDWLDLRWDANATKQVAHRARIEIALANETRALGKVCDLIGRYGANIEDVSTTQQRPDYFRMRFVITVRDTKHLNTILHAVGAESVVASAERIRQTSN